MYDFCVIRGWKTTRKLSWEEFYDKFYDWSPTTQKKYASYLAGFSSSTEVVEIILEYALYDGQYASKFARRACDTEVCFQSGEILKFIGTLDQDGVEYLAVNAAVPFEREQLEEINMLVSDETFRRLSKRAGIDIFVDDELPEDN